MIKEFEDKVILTTEEYIHVVALSGAEFDDNYFLLLPGEERTIHFTNKEDYITATSYTISE